MKNNDVVFHANNNSFIILSLINKRMKMPKYTLHVKPLIKRVKHNIGIADLTY